MTKLLINMCYTDDFDLNNIITNGDDSDTMITDAARIVSYGRLVEKNQMFDLPYCQG